MTSPSGQHLLLLLRHAIAEDAAPGGSDAERRLTGEGKRKLREVVDGMRALKLPIDVILTSPLKRAEETAVIVARGYGLDDGVIEIAPALSPGAGPDTVMRALSSVATASAVVLVGHQPDLGELASTLLVGTPGLLAIQFKKAGLAGIVVADLPPRGAGVLEFLLTPAQLRKVGRAS